MKKNLLSIFLVLASISVIAQRDANLYFLPAVQSTKLSPAIMPESKIVLGLPGLSGFGADLTNAFAIKDLFKAKGDSFQFDFNGLLSEIDADKNALNFKSDIDLFRLGFRLGKEKKTMFTLNSTEKISVEFSYPISLFEFLGGGSDPNNLNLSLSDVNLNVNHYREYGFTLAREINDKLNVGLGVKFLYGKSNISAERTNLSINSNITSGFSAQNDILIYNSGFNLADTSITDYIFNTDNSGMAFDLGANYKVNDKLELSFSAIDLGASINWKSDVEQVSSDRNYNYNGFDLVSADIAGSIDSITDVFKFDTAATAVTYKTKLPTKIYLGAKYNVTEKLNVGGLLYYESNESKNQTALSLVGKYKLSHLLSATVSYAAYNGSYGNLGFGFVLNGGPFQLFFTTDNILGLDVYGTKNVNLRFGTNFQFGRTDKSEKKDKSKKEKTTSML